MPPARTLRKGLLKRIHVDQHRIRANARDGTDLPVLTVQLSNGSRKAHEIEILGPSRVVSSARPLSCGARCWIETTAAVVLQQRQQEDEACPDITSSSPMVAG